MRLVNRVAIVTGAGTGIGQATALRLAEEGATVAVVGRNRERGRETVRIIESGGGKALFVAADVTDGTQVEAMVRQVVQKTSGVDILVNNAGVWDSRDGPATEMSEEVWDYVVDTNLKSVYLCCKYAIPAMVARGGGSIVNVASIIGLRAAKDHQEAYSASKGGIISVTRTIASTWGMKGIRCNAVCPGSIATPLTAKSYEEDWVREYWQKGTCLGRVGRPEEIANVILFLASDEASYVTGATVVADGGFTAK